MSSENRWIRFQPFDRLVPPLKITLSPAGVRDDPQRLRDVVVLLDDRLAQAARPEMLRRADDGLLEVRDAQTVSWVCAPSPAIRRACSSTARIPKSNRESGFKLCRNWPKPACRLPELLPDGPKHGADARRLRRRDFEQPLEASRLAEVAEQLVHGFLGRQLTRLPPVAEEVEQGGVRLGECPPRFRPAGMDDRCPCRR